MDDVLLLATDFAGENKPESEEGIIGWHTFDKIDDLAMAPGDYHIIDYLIKGNGIIYGTFVYTPDFELLSYRLIRVKPSRRGYDDRE